MMICCVGGAVNAHAHGGTATSRTRRVNIATNVPLSLPTVPPSPSGIEAVAPVSSLDPTEEDPFGSFMQQPNIVKQDFTQILQVSSHQEFNDEQITSYETIVSSYTEQYGFAVASPQVASACEVTAQNIVSIAGRNGNQMHLLTLSFNMGYDSRYEYDVRNYPALFEAYINSNLDSVTSNLQSAFLPVNQAKDVTLIGTYTYSPTTSSSPTDSPTPKTTWSPSREPSSSPTTLQPSLSPSSKPSRPPSKQPTSSPSSTPSKPPSQSPVTMNPTSTPSKSPSQSPSDKPTLPSRVYTVPSTMAFSDLNTLLDDEAQQTWIDVTQKRIHDATLDILGNDGEELDVTILVLEEEVRRSLLKVEKKKHKESHLRKLQSTPLQIDFTTRLQFKSEQDDWDANTMVSSGFESTDDQDEYMNTLRVLGSNAFENVKNMVMEVDGSIVTEERMVIAVMKTQAMATLDPNEPANSNSNIIIAGAVVGGSCLILILAGLVLFWRKKQRENDHAKHHQLEEEAIDESSSDTSNSNNNNEEEDSAIHHTITAVAPPGKIGVVIANGISSIDMPVVIQVKEDSPLAQDVRVGDFVLSMDEVDCRGVKAMDISTFIGNRSEANRTLVLLREA